MYKRVHACPLLPHVPLPMIGSPGSSTKVTRRRSCAGSGNVPPGSGETLAQEEAELPKEEEGSETGLRPGLQSSDSTRPPWVLQGVPSDSVRPLVHADDRGYLQWCNPAPWVLGAAETLLLNPTLANLIVSRSPLSPRLRGGEES